MKSKGAIPIPYLVALVIGLIIIAVIAYMFVTKTGIFAGFASEQECYARLKAYCIQWAASGWKERGEAGQKDVFKLFRDYAPECKKFTEIAGVNIEEFERNDREAQNACKQQLGIL